MTLQRFCWLHGMLVMLLLTSGLKAQVTVGSNNSPEKAALLDIKEKIDKTGGPTVDKGGLLLPRVNLEKKYQLYSFVRDARGKLWGEDASQTYVIQGLPAGDIYTYSGVEAIFRV